MDVEEQKEEYKDIRWSPESSEGSCPEGGGTLHTGW